MRPKHLLPLLLAATLTSTSVAADLAVTHAQKGDITRSIQLLGEVKPYQQVTLHAKISGYVSKVGVELGDQIVAGRTLIELEVPELLAEQTRTEAELNLAQLEQKRTAEAAAKAPDLVIRQTVDNAEARLAIAKAQHLRVQTLLGFANITAPFAGTITRRNVDKGTFVPAATSTSSVAVGLLTLTDSTRVRVQAAVPEYEAPLVAIGLPFAITTEAGKTRNYAATVTRFADALDSNSKTMLIEAELANPRGELKPGMYANVRLGIETHKGAMLLPAAAVVVEKTGSAVFLHQAGKAVRKVIRTGFSDGANFEVLEGVSAEDSILVVGTATLTDGQPVTLVK